MRRLTAFGVLLAILPLSGCAEGVSGLPPQTRLETPQPRLLKVEARQTPVNPLPVAPPASAPQTKPIAAAPADPKAQEPAKPPADQVVRIESPAPATASAVQPAAPAPGDQPIRIQFERKPRERGNESRASGWAFPAIDGSDAPTGVPGPDRGRQFKTPPLPAGLPAWFAERDQDKDGQVGMFEWPKDELDEFAKADRNGDGYITPEELVKVPLVSGLAATPAPSAPAPAANGSSSPDPAATATGATPFMIPLGGPATPGVNDDERSRRFAEDTLRRYDRNNDSKLDAQELERTMTLRTNWQQYDANKDSVLDLGEITAYMKSRATTFSFNWGGPAGPGGGPTAFGGPGGPPAFGGRGDRGGDRDRGNRRDENGSDRAREMFGRFDQNRDGKVTESELPGFFRIRFTEWDTNKDGQLSAEELSAGMGSFGGPGGFGGNGPGRRGPGR